MQILEPLRSQWARRLECVIARQELALCQGMEVQVHLKGSLTSKWSCNVSTILFLLCVLHALNWPPQLSLSPWRKLVQTYRKCPVPAICHSQGSALAAFSSCRRNQERAHHSFPTDYFCQSGKWRVDLPTRSQTSSIVCASLLTDSEVWVGHPRVDGSRKALGCLSAAMQFESMMVLQCFCNRLRGSSCFIPLKTGIRFCQNSSF